jgi:hypothetical protein
MKLCQTSSPCVVAIDQDKCRVFYRECAHCGTLFKRDTNSRCETCRDSPYVRISGRHWSNKYNKPLSQGPWKRVYGDTVGGLNI